MSDTKKGLTEVCTMIDDIIFHGTLTLKQAQVARGRLAFCDAHVFGRSGRSTLQEVTKHGLAKPFRLHISSALKAKLIFLRGRLMNAKPRCISSDIAISWSLYTDASYSPDGGGGLGAVLVDHHGMCVSWFSLMVDSGDLSFLETGCNETVIAELETLI